MALLDLLVFNDTFGLMADAFGSAHERCQGRVRARTVSTPYPFGIDPAAPRRQRARLANSYKMKLSIILGVLQMCLGLFCSLLNAMHFRNVLDIWCEFVPQAIFFLSIFGYLCFCIVYKWLTDWVALKERPPSLISMLIAFFMSPGEIPPDAELYDGQAGVQLILVSLAAIAVPWMLPPSRTSAPPPPALRI